MKRFFTLVLVLITLFVLTSCSNNISTEVPSNTSTTWLETTLNTQNETVAITNEDPENEENRTSDSFQLVDESGNNITSDNNIYTITTGGTYTASGKLENGQIVVNASSSDKVTISLSNAYISNSTISPILVLSANKVDVEAKKETYNEIVDTRTNSSTNSNDETNYDGAIYAECDLKISGKGILIVTSSYDNGIKTKDDLEIANLTLKVTSPGNALKGADSITVESGNLTLISTQSDGIKTANTTVSSKNKQKGNIEILGGVVDVYSYADGISAAYDFICSGEDAVVNIYTSTYSNASTQTQGKEFYLILSSSAYSTSYDYYAYVYNNKSGEYIKFTYDSPISGNRVTYQGLKTTLPDNYTGMMIYIVEKGVTPDNDNYKYLSTKTTINTSMNAYLITKLSSTQITGDFVQVTQGSNSNKTTYSSKGIKAGNEINISAGNFTIYAKDDALHVNNDVLENESNGKGNVYISGGTFIITSADDGIHADNILEISGGYINIVESHEGLEGNIINIKGGTTYVVADDDGANAFKGSSTPSINISGGYLDITTSSGDTDGIDSNGNITISGGFTIVKGGSSQGMVAGSVDLDGTLKVTGGTIVALGGICETPSSGSVCTYIQSSTSFSSGKYTLVDSNENELLSFELSSNYSSIWISSSLLSLNGKYKIQKDNTTVLEWTQSQTTVGSSNSGGSWFGPGGRR